MKYNPYYIKRLVVIVVLILVVVGVASLIHSSHLRIVSTDPNVNQMTTWTPFFKITFSKKVSAAGLSVSSSPKIIYNNKVDVSGNTVTVNLNVPLDSNQTYTIILNNISSTDGQRITNKIYRFKPASVSRNQLGEDEQEALLQRNQASKAYQDPILSHLPYRSVDFNLTSSFGAGANNLAVLRLQAQLLLHFAQLGDKPAAVAADKQEVLDYIKSLGLDPNKYTIQYTVVSP